MQSNRKGPDAVPSVQEVPGRRVQKTRKQGPELLRYSRDEEDQRRLQACQVRPPEVERQGEGGLAVQEGRRLKRRGRQGRMVILRRIRGGVGQGGVREAGRAGIHRHQREADTSGDGDRMRLGGKGGRPSPTSEAPSRRTCVSPLPESSSAGNAGGWSTAIPGHPTPEPCTANTSAREGNTSTAICPPSRRRSSRTA